MNQPTVGLKILALGISFFASAAVYAVDGVILIDQNKAIAGGVTPADGPGFPVTISQPGSYRLSSNLTMPNASATAIQITADNVSLDLNGFSIIGTGTFPNAVAITGDGRKRIRVLNGFISGFVSAMDFVGSELVHLERLLIDGTTVAANGTVVGGGTIRVGRTVASRAIIREVVTTGQVQLSCPGLVMDTIAGSGVVEVTFPTPPGGNPSFPTNCVGENVQ
jgi:hypothetical protein